MPNNPSPPAGGQPAAGAGGGGTSNPQNTAPNAPNVGQQFPDAFTFGEGEGTYKTTVTIEGKARRAPSNLASDPNLAMHMANNSNSATGPTWKQVAIGAAVAAAVFVVVFLLGSCNKTTVATQPPQATTSSQGQQQSQAKQQLVLVGGPIFGCDLRKVPDPFGNTNLLIGDTKMRGSTIDCHDVGIKWQIQNSYQGLDVKFVLERNNTLYGVQPYTISDTRPWLEIWVTWPALSPGNYKAYLQAQGQNNLGLLTFKVDSLHA